MTWQICGFSPRKTNLLRIWQKLRTRLSLETWRPTKPSDVKALSEAGLKDVSFLDNKRYADAFSISKAGACVVEAAYANRAPSGMVASDLRCPVSELRLIASAFYPLQADESTDVSANAYVAASASVGDGARIEAGAVIQAHAEISAGVHISSGVVVGPELLSARVRALG